MKVRYLLIALLLLIVISSVSADWLTGWNYRKELHINGSVTGDVTDYQIMISVYNTTGSDSGADVYIGDKAGDDTYLSDIRFTTDDGTTLCDTWNETVYADHSDVWVKVPSIDDATGADLYIYYGSTVGEVWDGDATFIFFDDFNGASLDTEKWSALGDGVSIANSIINLECNISGWNSILSLNTFGLNTSLRSRASMYANTNYIGYNSNSIGEQARVQKGRYSRTSKASVSEDQFMGNYYANFYTFEISRNYTNSVIFSVDNTIKTEHFTQVTTLNHNIRLYSYDSAGEYIRSDWVFVRQYQYPEPAAASWSAEETAPCTAIFSGTPLSGSTPLTVQFTDASTTEAGTINSWTWDFGDGSPGSTDDDPAHTYTTSGCYDVKLKVTNTLGAYDWENKTAYVCAGNVTPTPTTTTPTPTGTIPVQGDVDTGRISPLGFVMLAFLNLGLVLHTFVNNESRNYLHVFTGIVAVIVSFMLGTFLITGFVQEDFVVTAAEVTVNSSVLSTYQVEQVSIIDAGVGYYFVFIGILMALIVILSVIEIIREIQEG